MLYNFRIREALNLLRIQDLNSQDFINSQDLTEIVTIIIYPIFIKNVFKNNALKELTFEKSISHAKMNLLSVKINLLKIISQILNSNLSLRSRVTNINKYRFIYINIKNIIIFTSLKMKKVYDL